MKVQIQKNLLINALEKMYNVSTKALIPGYNFTGRVTIEVQSSKVLFVSSNGCITVQTEITDKDDKNIKGSDRGVVTTDSVKLRNSVAKIVTEDTSAPLELYDDGNTLMIRDATSKRKKLVKLPRYSEHHKISVIKKPEGDSSFMDTNYFLRGVKTVVPFQSTAGYKPEYQVVCFHWIGKESRIICGDGGLFAIFTIDRHAKDTSKREIKRTIPAVQLDVISSLVSGPHPHSEDETKKLDELEIVWKQKELLWIKNSHGVELVARGLPDISYVAYHEHGYMFDDAKAYSDIKISDLMEVSDLLGVLRDKEKEEQGKTHSCFFTAPSQLDGHVHFEITADQGKFQCEYEIPAVYHDLGDMAGFRSRYAHLFFDNPVHAARHPYLRFYLIKEEGTINVRDVDLGEPDDNGVPIIKKEPDECSLTFFFAALRDDEEDE